MNDALQFGATCLTFCFGLFVFFCGLFEAYDRRRVENTPTTQCQSAALGPLELVGTVAGEKPMASLLARVPAFISILVVKQLRRSGKSQHWLTVHKSQFRTSFSVRDETGEISVDPHGADLWLSPDVVFNTESSDTADYSPDTFDRMLDSGSTQTLSELLRDFCAERGISMTQPVRFVETNLCPGDKVYVLGTAVRGLGDDDEGPIVVRRTVWRPLLIAEGTEASVIHKFRVQTARHLVAGSALCILAGLLLAVKSDASTKTLTIDPTVVAPAIVPIIVILSAVAALAYALVIYNGLISTRNEVDRTWANIDVVLQKRFDLIPTLVEICSGYMQHERDVLRVVTAARSGWNSATKLDDKVRTAGEAGVALRSLFAVAENYPVLRANETFAQLLQALTTLEQQIADRRELYNAAVTLYNTRIELVPDRWVARLSGFAERPFYGLRSGAVCFLRTPAS
jgi:LemA protein